MDAKNGQKDEFQIDKDETFQSGLETFVGAHSVFDDPSGENIGALFGTAGALAGMIVPPPAGPVIGGGLAVTGALIGIFGPKSTKVVPPSAEFLEI